MHLNENAGKGNKAQLINKNGVVVATINNVDAEENGIPKTIDRELEFTVTDYCGNETVSRESFIW